jgi:long-chain acyl-CoA synthetase
MRSWGCAETGSLISRASGLRRLDRYAIFIEDNARYVEYCGAGECVGLYYT